MERKYWLDDSANVKVVLRTLYGLCAGLLAIDLIYHRHAILSFEKWFGFYAAYGFVACITLVLTAKLLRKLLARREDYYERGSDDR